MHEEVCLALAQMPVDYTGGSHRAMGIMPPGREAEAVANLEWMAGTIGTDVHLSVMSQYTPVHAAAARDGWNRVVTEAEYARVTEAVERLGFENGWVQEFGACAPDDGLLGCDMLPGAGVAGAGRCAQACL